jgi:hypothetical protein
MKTARLCASLSLLLAVAPLAAQTAASPPDAKTSAKRPEADLEQLIHKAVLAQLPRVHEDASGWGQTIPRPDNLLLPGLKRTVVRVGDRLELPHGLWRKVRLKVEDPDQDLKIHVRDFQKVDTTTYRLTVAADVAMRSETDVQQWVKGLNLASLTARADVGLTVRVECDVSTRLDTKKLPPALVMEPQVRDLKLDLTSFELKGVTLQRPRIVVQAEVEGVGEEFKGALQAVLRSLEPQAKKHAGETLARGMKEGKGPLTPAAMLKAAMPLLMTKQGK